MTTQQAPRQIKITIPDTLYQWLSDEARRRALDIPAVVQAALEHYVQHYDLTKTQTWQLCGAFTIAEPEPPYVVDSDGTGAPTTDYAEHVDDVLYEGK
jgi:hypothetical protein